MINIQLIINAIFSEVFIIGCIGAIAWVFLIIVTCNSQTIFQDKIIPPWSIAVIYIFLGGTFAYLLASQAEHPAIIFFKGFSWPGLFINIYSNCQQSGMRRGSAMMHYHFSNEDESNHTAS